MRNLGRWLVVSLILCSSCKNEYDRSIGEKAFNWTREIIELGPRPPGSLGLRRTRDWIENRVSEFGMKLVRRPFMAITPRGKIEMVNLTYDIPGDSSNNKVLLVAHYDSKYFDDRVFLGANDAASSVALLLALTPSIKKMHLPFTTQIAFVDGEEALVEWRKNNDHLYGSNQMAQDVAGQKSIKAVVVIDMVGDKDLQFIRTRGVDETLLSYFEDALREMGQGNRIDKSWTYGMEDDHVPFAQAGFPVFHIMDFTFGSKTSPGPLWHTSGDDMQSISAESLSITGEALLRLLKKIKV